MKDNLSDKLYLERHLPHSGLFMEYTQKLVDIQSPYQHIEVYDTPDYGHLLTLDSLVMITQRDEFYYHEMLTHPVLFGHPNPSNVLVIGGGDGGTVREIARHERVKQIVLCEIDEKVIDVCREYFPQCTCQLDDPRVEIICKDGFEYLKETKNHWDIIFMDTTDPIGPGTVLFTAEFYQLVFNALNETGMCCSQSEDPDRDFKVVKNLFQVIKGVFPQAFMYTCPIYTYPGTFWTFTVGSKKYAPRENFQRKTYQKLNKAMKYYNDEIHQACFALPQFVKEKLSEA